MRTCTMWLMVLFGSIAIFIISCDLVPVAAREDIAKEYPNYSKEYPNYSEELLGLINQYRTVNGLQALSSDNKLIAIAEGHSLYMYRRDALNHDYFHERFVQSGSDRCVENVGWNYWTAREEFNAWRRSEGHNRNMLDQDIRKAGISIVGPYVTFFACR